MPSDLVVNIRQISNYPTLPQSDGTETVLLQQGGVGGPYVSISTSDLISSALHGGPALGVGIQPPNNADAGQIFTGEFVVPSDGALAWNAYTDTNSQWRLLSAGSAASIGWDPTTGLGISISTAGSAQSLLTWVPILNLSNAGAMSLPYGTLTVARDPATKFEVATMGWVQDSFALSMTQAISSFISNYPLVTHWNGRDGEVWLTLSDITCVFFQPGQQPISQTPPPDSNDYSIATTNWVTSHVPAPTLTAPPLNPNSGQLWWDATDGNLYVWYDDGTSAQWVSAMAGLGSAVVASGSSPPVSPQLNMLWWDTAGGQLYIYYDDGTSSQWVIANNVVGLSPAGGTMTGPLIVTATGATTSRSVQDQFAEPLNVKDYGAIGDGNTHPLSSVTPGWTLAQWQAVYPFATALTNEIDQCAILLTIQHGATNHRAVYAPGGRYQCNFAPNITVNGAFKFFGGGMAATCLEVTNTTATALPLTIAAGTVNSSLLIDLASFSVYPTHTNLGGMGIVITGPTGSSSTIGRPDVHCFNLTVGLEAANPQVTGAFAVGMQLNNVGTANVLGCSFWGSQNTGLGSPNSLSGTGFQLQGNGTTQPTGFYAFGPNMVNCEFGYLNQSVVIGDGVSTAFTQGAKFTQCTWVDVNYCIVWRSNNAAAGNDYLSIQHCDLAYATIGVWTDTVSTHTIGDNYFLGYGGSLGIRIDNTGNMNSIQGVIGHNSFSGYGSNSQGVAVNNAATQSALIITSNSFFDFNATGAPAPIVLNAGTSGITLNGNVFRDNTTLPSDLGTSNHWTNTMIASTTGQNCVTWLVGVPTAQPGDNANHMTVPTSRALFMDSGHNTNISSDGSVMTLYAPTVYVPDGLTTGSIYVSGVSNLVGNIVSTATFAAAGGWSSNNFGKQLLVTGGGNPAIGITDASGANLWAIANGGGAGGNLEFAQMPAYNNTTTAPVYIVQINANGLNATALGVGGSSGPTWTTGSAAPASTQPVGSLYSRVGGAVGATLYVSRGGGTWAAVTGV